ncbi:MAG TPA: GNAT family N-acetyltransferase [Candidatus Limnocylindria bacterium]|nr:GNAT family N-acetyltransferase [Candidatus Limnocylindria bacterium]
MTPTQTITPRLFAPGDYEGYKTLENRCYPEYPGTVEELRHRDEIWDHSKFFMRRMVVEEGGRIVGAADLNHQQWEFQADKYHLGVMVDPDARRRGIGTALYEDQLRVARERKAIQLITGVKESMTDGLEFALHRDFKEAKRDWESRLDVTSFDASAFAEAPRRVAAEGITITTLAQELARDRESIHAVYELDCDCVRDVPSTDPVTTLPFETWRKEVLESPNSTPDAFYIAVDRSGRYLGLSNLWRSLEDPSFIWQGLTGVRREARGKGIAMALKLRTVEYAREHGIREIKTWNDQKNRPMLRINEAMGFVKQPAWIELRKDLEP